MMIDIDQTDAFYLQLNLHTPLPWAGSLWYKRAGVATSWSLAQKAPIIYRRLMPISVDISADTGIRCIIYMAWRVLIVNDLSYGDPGMLLSSLSLSDCVIWAGGDWCVWLSLTISDRSKIDIELRARWCSDRILVSSGREEERRNHLNRLVKILPSAPEDE